MAKIVITIDTEEDMMDVNVEGETLSNVQEVCAYMYDSYEEPGEKELSVRISMMEHSKTSDITKVTYLMANDSRDAKSREIAKASTVPLGDFHGLIKVYSDDTLKAQISNFFKNNTKK